MRKITIAALALSLAAFATPASAETTSVEVRFDDLNLASAAGMAALERRVDRAIERVCGADTRPLYKVVQQQQCAREAKASANEQIARIANGNTVIALNR
jgi:UrcA family protein